MSKTTTQDNTIYIFQFSGRQETKEDFMKRVGDTSDQEIIKGFIDAGYQTQWFMGTQSEYDELNNDNIIYYELNSIAFEFTWKWSSHLIDGKKGNPLTLKDIISDPTVKELSKVEYDILKAKNEADDAFNLKISNLKSISSPKLAAYIAKGEDYINLHIDKVSSGTLSTFVGTNGKIDMNALKVVMQGHQDKINSMVLIVQLFAKYIVAIETGTEASLKELPFDTPTALNAEIDSLWKIEVDKERQELSTKLNIPMTIFAIIDKYLITVSGDEPDLALAPKAPTDTSGIV